MILVVCIDDDLGMSFNGRRQSQDRNIYLDLVEECKGTGNSKLYMKQDSFKLFKEVDQNNIIISEIPLDEAGKKDFVFMEGGNLERYIQKIEKIIIYKWNKKYPGDVFFDIDVKSTSNKEYWGLEVVKELTGYSHEKITKEIYNHTRRHNEN